ncbi:MAG: dipeptidase [Planctomycetota bacterium]|nr:dipeptidase [Planctomycetota bacterium]
MTMRTFSKALIAVSCCFSSCHSGPSRLSPAELHAEALRIHGDALVFDGHNDLLGEVRDLAHSSFDGYDLSQRLSINHTDIPRLQIGNVGAQFWSAFVPVSEMKTGTSARYCNEQIDLIHAMCARYPDAFELATTCRDVERIHANGKIASLIGIEGGHAIESSLAKLDAFYARGARYMTLTHNDTTDWADSATDEPVHGGLSPFGEEVVREMNRLGMIVDISHVSADTMRDVLRVSSAPIIASHSSAFALAPHPRNVPDDVLEALTRNGGVVMVNFSPNFLDPDAARVALGIYPFVREIAAKTSDENERKRLVEDWRRAHPIPSVSFTRVVDHIEHIARVAGVDHVGLGSDFDGISAVPVGLEDVSRFPVITEELLRRGWNETDIEKVLGLNALRVLCAVEDVAKQMRASADSSHARR